MAEIDISHVLVLKKTSPCVTDVEWNTGHNSTVKDMTAKPFVELYAALDFMKLLQWYWLKIKV